MYCPSCGERNPADSRYCQHCGADLSAGAGDDVGADAAGDGKPPLGEIPDTSLGEEAEVIEGTGGRDVTLGDVAGYLVATLATLVGAGLLIQGSLPGGALFLLAGLIALPAGRSKLADHGIELGRWGTVAAVAALLLGGVLL